MSTVAPAIAGIPSTMEEVVDMVRELSLINDPQELVRTYGARVRRIVPTDATVSISRRGLSYPFYKVTRDTRWTEAINPWTQPEKLKIYSGGLIAELIYGDQPRIIPDLMLAPGDPAHGLIGGYGSLLAIPQYDGGHALNMILSIKFAKDGFDPGLAPFIVWMSNLFGRATNNLVLSEKLKEANQTIERELRIVADLQRSLLPRDLPKCLGLRLDQHYEPSRFAGGDYYDFFCAGDGKIGLLIADVSGHGTPAAVMMAMTHTLARAFPGPGSGPSELLGYLNERLFSEYELTGTGFVTAFYGVFDPKAQTFSYSSAGHNPPRLRAGGGNVIALDQARELPLGIARDTRFDAASITLSAGDSLVLYTDGITEARNHRDELFGEHRLDASVAQSPDRTIPRILTSVHEFTGDRPADDDRTLLTAHVL